MSLVLTTNVGYYSSVTAFIWSLDEELLMIITEDMLTLYRIMMCQYVLGQCT